METKIEQLGVLNLIKLLLHIGMGTKSGDFVQRQETSKRGGV